MASVFERKRGFLACEVARTMALTRSVLLAWYFCVLFSSYINNVVEGGRMLSREEDIELEKQLKLLNKPAVKTIQTEYGDTYDCVDFYEQPAFDHPLLKNHTFHYEMRPSSLPKDIREKESSATNKTALEVVFKGIGCPYGTVPIRRVTKDDLIRAKLYKERYNSKNGSEFGVLTLDDPGTHYALVRSKFDPSKKYNGAAAAVSIYCPSVESSQYSAARMKIKNDPDSIQVGWTVNPPLYSSRTVRLYTYFKTRHSQCFNLQCPGFVTVYPGIPLDTPLPISEIGAATTYDLEVLIYRDQANGNWWLDVKENNEHKQLGFWPRQIFSSLADLAYEIEFGGEVSGSPYIPSAPMGSSVSFKGKGDIRHDAFFHYIRSVNEAHETVLARDLEEYKDVDTDAYQLRDLGNDKEGTEHVVFFGGPGGITGN